MSLIQTFPSGKKSENGGHTIINANDIAMPAQDKLKFGGDLETTDNNEDGQTEVAPHELTNAEMQEIMSVIPGAPRKDRVSGGFTPVGTVISVMGNTAPLHYLACNGQTVNIADYPELANYFNTQFGSKNYFGGDGTTTFGMPDLRGEFLRGAGTNSHTNQGSGAAVGVHQDATEFPYLYSGKTNSDHPYIGFKIRGNLASSEYNAITNIDKNIARYSSATFGTAVATTEGTSSTPTDCGTSRPTNTSVLYCIATKDIYMNPSNNYSTDEKVVGTWVDGKPLYQKTYNFGALPNNTTKTLDTGFADGEVNIIDCTGYAFNPTANHTWKLPAAPNPTDLKTSILLNAPSSSGRRVINIQSGTNRSAWTECYITLQYTKTTD